jgi:heme ABC exporter ATP-binding subunit CcmA
VSDLYLEIRGLKKSFGLKPVLRGIDLSLPRGGRMALMGANGAGKTTLLRILAALTRPGSGSVTINGLDIERDAQQVRRLVGFVAHQPYLYDELSALENLLFFGKMYGVKDAQARSRQLLKRVGLERRAGDRVGTFSRGMVQRLSLARALLHAPQFLLLDEPDTGLDQEGVQIVTTLLDEHTRQGGTALFTTHQPERAYALANNIITLHGGRIIHKKTVGVGEDADDGLTPTRGVTTCCEGSAQDGPGDVVTPLVGVRPNGYQRYSCDQSQISPPTAIGIAREDSV